MRVGIIYPDEAKLREIKGWLSPFSANNQIVSFTTLRQAVPILRKAPCDFLLTGDRFAEAEGLLLLKGLRKLCPAAEILMVASRAEDSEGLALETQGDLNTLYFAQPWDMQSLLAHIEAAIGADAPSFTLAFALDEGQAQRVSEVLENLQKETGAFSIYLVTNLGQVLDYKGSELAQIGEISSLLGGSFTALNQLSHIFCEGACADNLIHQQGAGEDVYALSIGDSALLVLRFLHNTNTARIGTVSYYARRSVNSLAKILAEGNKKPTLPLANEDMKDALDTELDHLFGTDEDRPAPGLNPRSPLLSYTQALRQGLVTMGLEGRFSSAASSRPTGPLQFPIEEENE